MQGELFNSQVNEEEIGKPFTIDELEYIIKRTKNRKSPGPNLITHKIIKSLPSNKKEEMLKKI